MMGHAEETVMERRFAMTLCPGERVDATFALTAKEMRVTRTGEAYLVLEFADRSGRIPGIMFRPGRDAEAVPTGVVVRVRGVVTEYRGVARVSVESVRAAEEYEPRDIIPAGMREERELVAELRGLVRAVSDRSLGALLREVFGDAAFMTSFKECPASRSAHHAYLGGLLEHTVGVAAVCRQLASLRRQLDADLLLTGALIHDMGMVDGLVYETGIDHTDEGRLVGHAVLGERRLRSAVGRLGNRVSRERWMMLAHMILTHHAEPGSPGTGHPATLEALALHHADTLDRETAGFIAVSTRASIVGESWTDGANPFGRRLRAPGADLAPGRAAEPEAPGYPRSA
jgi:3'-5' exoribonuclease